MSLNLIRVSRVHSSSLTSKFASRHTKYQDLRLDPDSQRYTSVRDVQLAKRPIYETISRVSHSLLFEKYEYL